MLPASLFVPSALMRSLLQFLLHEFDHEIELYLRMLLSEHIAKPPIRDRLVEVCFDSVFKDESDLAKAKEKSTSRKRS